MKSKTKNANGVSQPAPKAEKKYTRLEEAPVTTAPLEILTDSVVGMRLMTEMIGVFFLTLIWSQCGIFVTSLMLAALTFMGANESQAHYNPAISICYLVLGTSSVATTLSYIVFQVAGATMGGVVAATLFGTSTLAATPDAYDLDDGIALLAPMLIYALVHLAVLAEGNRSQFFGLAIGFAVYAGVVAYGDGSSLLNPSISIGNWIASWLLGNSSKGLFSISVSWSTLSLANPILNQAAFLVLTGAVGAIGTKLYEVSNGDSQFAIPVTEFLGTFLSVLLVIGTADEGKETSAQAVRGPSPIPAHSAHARRMSKSTRHPALVSPHVERHPCGRLASASPLLPILEPRSQRRTTTPS